MKQLLTTLLLIIVVIVIYTHVFGGASGVTIQLHEHGQQVNKTIERINLYGEDAMP